MRAVPETVRVSHSPMKGKPGRPASLAVFAPEAVWDGLAEKERSLSLGVRTSACVCVRVHGAMHQVEADGGDRLGVDVLVRNVRVREIDLCTHRNAVEHPVWPCKLCAHRWKGAELPTAARRYRKPC